MAVAKIIYSTHDPAAAYGGGTMNLIMVQFLAWVAERPRTYDETMDAWRTSCPRLSVWEDATIEGYVCREAGPRGRTLVRLTARGHAALAAASAHPAVDTSKIGPNRVREEA